MASADAVFEFQRLHGMGEALYEQMRENSKQCRIYARSNSLLAYLVCAAFWKTVSPWTKLWTRK